MNRIDRITSVWGLALVAALACASPAAAQRVYVEGGNVLFEAANGGAARQLTRGGMDLEAALSRDGRTVAFVRRTPGRSVSTGSGMAEWTELWTVAADGSGARMRLRGGPDSTRAEGEELAGFQAPRFSPDGGTIYFLTRAWATSGAVHALDVASGREHFVAPGNSLEVVPRGQYAGHLIVSQHRYFVGGGSYDWLWLLAPDGREVGPLGDDTPERLAAFRETYEEP